MSLYIKKINKRKISNILLNSFLGNLIKKGNYLNANKVYIDLLEFIKLNNLGKEPQKTFLELLSRIKPAVGVRSKKVAGINYQLPCPITEDRACKVAVSWFFKSLDNRNEKTLINRIESEILDISKSKGFSLQKKHSFEKLALDNRPFLHFLKK
jgi:small subunit ribosomal protein S7